MDEIFLRQATNADRDIIKSILIQGRQAQRSFGFYQWGDDYPSEQVVENDVVVGNGYILDVDGAAAGYVAIADKDTEYERLDNIWHLHGLYAVFHRIAIADAYRGKGFSNRLFDLAERKVAKSGIKIIRVDTGIENIPMQHILSHRGYYNCGLHDFSWGPRLAFEKILP